MNERIKELAKNAGLEMCGCGCDMPTRQSAKFAELIVRECAKFARQYNLEKADRSYMIHSAIKQQFGVEE